MTWWGVAFGSILLKSCWTRMEGFEDWRMTLGKETRLSRMQRTVEWDGKVAIFYEEGSE